MVYRPYYRREQEARGEISSTFTYTLSEAMRIKLLRFLEKTNYPLVESIHDDILSFLGRAKLSRVLNPTPLGDFRFAWEDLDDAIILSITELLCIQLEKFFRQWGYGHDYDDTINLINEAFQYERIGYKFIKGKPYGTIIKIEDETFFSEVTSPALSILASLKYTDAREHVIESYKKLASGDYRHAINEVCCGIESLIKSLLTDANIPFDPKKATLNSLLDTVNASLETSFYKFQPFKEFILNVGRERNDKSHGQIQGTYSTVDEPYTRFIINQATAAILFLAEVKLTPP